jgi:hypothetical protein
VSLASAYASLHPLQSQTQYWSYEAVLEGEITLTVNPIQYEDVPTLVTYHCTIRIRTGAPMNVTIEGIDLWMTNPRLPVSGPLGYGHDWFPDHPLLYTNVDTVSFSGTVELLPDSAVPTAVLSCYFDAQFSNATYGLGGNPVGPGRFEPITVISGMLHPITGIIMGLVLATTGCAIFVVSGALTKTKLHSRQPKSS